MRKFKSGATRDTTGGKIEYLGFRHPLCEHSFGKYMHKHRLQSNGELRASNNWWMGWDKEISIQSMNRHLEDLNAIHAGLAVVKERRDGEEITHYLKMVPEFMVTKLDQFEVVTTEDCLNAIRFNTQSYLLEELK